MTKGIKTIIYPVKDIAKAKRLFTTLLGAEPEVDQPHYVGFTVDGQHIGLDPSGHGGAAGPVGYWHVDDIRKSMKALLDAGASILQEAKGVGGGRLIATVKDGDGNVIGLLRD